MSKMPHARKEHRDIVLIRGRDHFRVAHSSAGLNDCRDTRARRKLDAVGKRKKSIAR